LVELILDVKYSGTSALFLFSRPYIIVVQGQTHQNNDFDFAFFLDWHF
jgi:hypothetical protein